MSDLISLPGQPASAQVRGELAAEGRPVLLAFSRGKDSVAAWLALREAGVVVVPYHMYLVPNLVFVAESLTYFERVFGVRIVNIPHPSLYRALNNFVFQSPERLAVIEAAELPDVSCELLVDWLREDYAEPGSWVADGVRAADSPVRRLSMATHGVRKAASGKVSVVWDWRKAHVMDAIESAGIRLPVEYEWFGRSFDGLDARFLGPLKEHAPDDYQRVLDWFPLADLDLMRHAAA